MLSVAEICCQPLQVRDQAAHPRNLSERAFLENREFYAVGLLLA
jgi:hypothetical protein